MEVEVELISASANLVHNALELSEKLLFFASNHALAIYSLHDEKVVRTFVEHEGRINCVRFVRDSDEEWLLSCGADGRLILWHNLSAGHKTPFLLQPTLRHEASQGALLVCDGIVLSHNLLLLAYITSLSTILICQATLLPESLSGCVEVVEEIELGQSVALEVVFHSLLPQKELLLALGMDSGEVRLYARTSKDSNKLAKVAALKKHEDWVRSIAFTTLENGETLLGSGGQDSFIAIWRLSQVETGSEWTDAQFEFQIQHFLNTRILFDSLVIGHEGWINSLQWNNKGELLSCSSDHSIILWQNGGEIWTEKARLGTVGGQIPGGFGAKFNANTVVTWGFQGAIQIWNLLHDEWIVRASVTGHFAPISDLEYHPEGHFLVSTSLDQTTRVFAPWGSSRWHEIGRPQIHGHDLFAVTCSGDFIVSGAEEKILRAFQPTQILLTNLEQTSQLNVHLHNVADHSASLPALGLSNQSGLEEEPDCSLQSLDARLDEDFLRTHTLWPEVAKLYGHVYEISCIAASPTERLVASGSESSKPQFSSILLWDAETWKNLGQYPHHKLNVTHLTFSPDGRKLLSVSRDRTWAIWNIRLPHNREEVVMAVGETGGYHTRALWVGAWAPSAAFFVTGARDKKLVVWKAKEEEEQRVVFERESVQMFDFSVTAAAVNGENVIGVGLESGLIFLLRFSSELGQSRLESLMKLDRNLAHHSVVKTLQFNPKHIHQLASAGADRLLKVFRLSPSPLSSQSNPNPHNKTK